MECSVCMRYRVVDRCSVIGEEEDEERIDSRDEVRKEMVSIKGRGEKG